MPVNLWTHVRPPSDAVALIDGDRDITYAELHDRVSGLAAELTDLGLEPGARVGISGTGPTGMLIGAYACFAAELTAVPVASGDDERDAATLAAALIEATIGHDLAVRRESPSTSQPRRPEVAMIIHTSGTTQSNRKGVLLGHASIGSTCEFMNRAMELTPDVREVVFAPLDHAFAFGRCHSVLSIGGSVALSPGLRLGDLLGWLRDGATALSTTPSTLAAMLTRMPDEFGAAAASLRWVQTGAMRFTRALRDQLCEVLPDARIYMHYGLSEAMRATFMELHAHPDKRHTEGPAADGVQIEIRDEATGEPLGIGREGRIALSGSNLCLGYTDEALWQEAFHDGWYLTNDIGCLDADGFLVFGGRSDDVINANGNIVHPDEIEARLAPLLGAAPYCVVGVPDPAQIRDAVVVLCVEGDEPPPLREVRAAMGDAPDFMVPKQVVSVAEIPRTSTGKVTRARLRTELARLADSVS